MRKLSIFFVSILVASVALFSSFTSINENSKSINQNPPSEFETLLNYLESNGDFINSDVSPAFISAAEVKKTSKILNTLLLMLEVKVGLNTDILKMPKM